jgi:type II secretory pathway component GspD/PulD (secretin)
MHTRHNARRPVLLLLGIFFALVSSTIPVQALQPVTGSKRRREQNTVDANDQKAAVANAHGQAASTNGQSEKNGPSITLTVVGNQILVQSADPNVVATVRRLVQSLTDASPEAGHFEVIRLQNANATDTAKVLDEAFNGPRQPPKPQPQLPAALLRRLGGVFAQAPARPPVERIRVVADTESNSLLVRASRLDMLEVRHMLKDAIDAGDTESHAIIRTFLLGPLRYAVASEVASALRNVYKEQMNANPTPSTVANMPRRLQRRLQNMNVDANGNLRTVSLSIGVDERTNSVVVACPEKLYMDVKSVVDQLEAASMQADKTVRVVAVKGLDPTLIQAAIDAVQGRSNNRYSTTGSRSSNASRSAGR